MMEIKADNSTFFGSLIKQAKSILVLVPEPREDHLAAAFFLEANLADEKKKVQIVTTGLPDTFKHMAEKISQKVPTQKLIVSFNWKENPVEKVSYKMEGDDFNFIISPSGKKIETDQIKFSYRGDEPDLVISLGMPSLKESSLAEPGYFENKTIVNLDLSDKNEFYGNLNAVNPSADSLCALVAEVFDRSAIKARPETGDLLLMGLRFATDNFNNVKHHTTFEAAAYATKIKEGAQIEPEKEKTPAPAEWLAPKIIRSKES